MENTHMETDRQTDTQSDTHANTHRRLKRQGCKERRMCAGLRTVPGHINAYIRRETVT